VVVAAIDRVREAFLAIDTDTGAIEDANPAAGAMLGVNRDALVGILAMNFVPKEARSTWWTHLDAIDEGDETRLFEAALVDASGSRVTVEASLTRFATRGRTLALVLMRPATRQPAHSAAALDLAAAPA
jgi:PAS domain S-box-containing protein